jgi:hypothetical protein
MTWDRRVAELMLTVAWVLVLPACAFGYIALDLVGSCAPARCSANGARVVVISALCVAVLIAIVGTVTSRRRRAEGRRAWPTAGVTLGSVLAALLAGVLGSAAATSGWPVEFAGASGRAVPGCGSPWSWPRHDALVCALLLSVLHQRASGADLGAGDRGGMHDVAVCPAAGCGEWRS